ncbi:zinc finger protein MAGPIE-like [Henckelia pumila]|uniref:zinc finger protein MAGPIE-like n=1 Tax=Henckelia pumila TaxID=405737 RepID=UPI003C6E8FFC
MADDEIFTQNQIHGSTNPPSAKKKRSLPGTPDPEAEVIALSPKTLMATNRFLCEICGKGFQRDQNLQLHRRGHNLPWKLKQRSSKEGVRKRVYVCPEKTCVHHHPSRALGDLTGIKKHFCRKHGEKKWKCEKCEKRYAVQSDWKAHSKTCGTREYKCDCGAIFSRRDSFITHRAFCDALAEETARITASSHMNMTHAPPNMNYQFIGASSLGPTPCMGQNFPPIFKPISSNDTNTPIIRSRGLSLWNNMAQNPGQSQPYTPKILEENMHPLGMINHVSLGTINNFSTHDSLITNIPCSNPPHISSFNHLNWDFGSKVTSSNINGTQDLTNINDHSLPLSTSAGIKDVSVQSLFSTQHQIISHQPSSATMSATALLQKAAQIGATTTDPSILGKFGFKSNDSIITLQENSFGQVCGASSVSSELVSAEENGLSALKQPQMYPSKRHRATNEEISVGETRDFLGVGMQSLCQPPSINGWT